MIDRATWLKVSPLSKNSLKLKDLIKIQKNLANRIRITKFKGNLNLIGGADVSFRDDFAYGVIVVLDRKTMHEQDVAWAKMPIKFPYIPTFLSFREVPSLVKAYRRLKIKPDILLVDGQGIAHPRKVGLASHLGVYLNVPTVGCAKSHLFGKHGNLGQRAGSKAALIDRKETLGYVVRTRDRIRPLFVSPGHKIEPLASVKVVMAAIKKYRLPEPLRQAHIISKRLLKIQ